MPGAPSLHLGSKRYLVADQHAFARLSGDYNPLHLDPIAARRTLIGGVAVHGLNLALTGLEWFLERTPAGVKSLSARFTKPVLLEKEVAFCVSARTSESAHIQGTVGGESAFEVTLQTVPFPSQDNEPPLPPLVPEQLVDADVESLSSARGALPLGMDADLARGTFHSITRCIGMQSLAELLALTRLVGMRCPGLHSVFNQFDVQFRQAGAAPALEYAVSRSDPRFRRLSIEVSGGRLTGALVAFVRPPPWRQPRIEEVASRVPRNLYSQSSALVIGGSRGLGELTAKLISSGGGNPTITYLQGRAEAEEVANEIRNWGGACNVAFLDVRNPDQALNEIFQSSHPSSLYYFATPKITPSRRASINLDLLAEFNDHYVFSFSRILSLCANLSAAKLRVFHPSSIYVTEHVRDFAEYAMSKKQAEGVCDFYDKYVENVEVHSERLPAMKTDQTLSLFPVELEDPLEILAPIVRRIEAVPSPA